MAGKQSVGSGGRSLNLNIAVCLDLFRLQEAHITNPDIMVPLIGPL